MTLRIVKTSADGVFVVMTKLYRMN
jgi:hypothetical protein